MLAVVTDAPMLDQEEIDAATEEYRRETLPLKAVAWLMVRYRKQIDADLSATDLIEQTGASRTAAYRAIQDLRIESTIPHIGTTHKQSRNPGLRDFSSRKPGLPVPQTGIYSSLDDFKKNESVLSSHAREDEREPFDSSDESLPEPPNGRWPMADRLAAAAELEELAPDLGWSAKVSIHCSGQSKTKPSWLVEAARIALSKDKREWGYVRGIFSKWDNKGESDGEKAARIEAENATAVPLPAQPRASPAMIPSDVKRLSEAEQAKRFAAEDAAARAKGLPGA